LHFSPKSEVYTIKLGKSQVLVFFSTLGLGPRTLRLTDATGKVQLFPPPEIPLIDFLHRVLFNSRTFC